MIIFFRIRGHKVRIQIRYTACVHTNKNNKCWVMKVCTFCLCLSACHPNKLQTSKQILMLGKPKGCQCTMNNTCMYTNSTLFNSSTNTKWFVSTRTWCKETRVWREARKRRVWRLNWEKVLWVVFWWIGCNFQH